MGEDSTDSPEAPITPERFRWLRKLAWWKQRFTKAGKRNSGNWFWLAGKSVPLASLNRNLWRGAEPTSDYFVMLTLSAVISVLGLLANSSATIIGAMIVAPLMGPMIAIAFAMVMNNRRLLKRAGLSMVSGTLLTIAISALISYLVGIDTISSEIEARVQPTLIDLGIALAAGAAGALAQSRRGIGDALPGVAIAVALVPPLSVIGIGIASGSRLVTVGSTLLFLTNLVGIIFSGGLIFLWQRYGSLQRAQSGLMVSVVILLLLGLPLGLSFHDLVLRDQTRREISSLVRSEIDVFQDVRIREIDLERREGILWVTLEVAARPDTITEDDVRRAQARLEDQVDLPLNLNVTLVPVELFEAPTQRSDGPLPPAPSPEDLEDLGI